jgi:hypothetical protein
MYYIEIDGLFWLKSIGETDENENTPIQICTNQSEALGFQSIEAAHDANIRFDIRGEIHDIV